ncbi:MAG: vWA domain-containing protein [Planctomycetota bacterium]
MGEGVSPGEPTDFERHNNSSDPHAAASPTTLRLDGSPPAVEANETGNLPDASPAVAVDAAIGAAPPAAATTESSVAVSVPPWRFERPPALDGLAFGLLLEKPPVTDEARALLCLAARAWGVGTQRERALELVSATAGEEWDLVRADFSAIASGGFAESTASADSATAPSHSHLVIDRARWLLKAADFEAAREKWLSHWKSTLAAAESSTAVAAWLAAARAEFATERDVVLLIDLSESMAAEVELLAAALRRFLPLTAGARAAGEHSRWRWGWIGYRDEVVDSFTLGEDLDAFVDSLSRWRAEGGGDVPEGLDRALFEALRFGGCPWRPGVIHDLIAIGDAPPPFERISSAISLMRSAHASPERYLFSVVGLVREDLQRGSIPAFAELAAVAGGQSVFLARPDELPSAWWQVLMKSNSVTWTAGPFAALYEFTSGIPAQASPQPGER